MQNDYNKLEIFLAAALVASSYSVQAVDELTKPQTMEDMWKIIQAQQKKIDQMSKKLESTTKTEKSKDVAEPDHKTNVLVGEVEKIRTEMFIPEDIEYKSSYGLGSAASKVYQVGKDLSVGGYGEANYQMAVDDENGNNANADFERLVLYVGYKFTDNILFNSEIEFEHSSTDKGGSVSVEFAALDFLLDPMANFRADITVSDITDSMASITQSRSKGVANKI